MLYNHVWEKQQTQRPKGSGPKFLCVLVICYGLALAFSSSSLFSCSLLLIYRTRSETLKLGQLSTDLVFEMPSMVKNPFYLLLRFYLLAAWTLPATDKRILLFQEPAFLLFCCPNY